MSNMILINPLVPVAFAGPPGAANVISPDPKEVWATSADPGTFEFDFGAPVAIDSLFIGFINAGSGAAFNWSSGAVTSGDVFHAVEAPIYSPSRSAKPLRRHGFRRLGAPVPHRYHRVSFFPGGLSLSTVGIIALGLAFQTEHNREKGGGRTVIDTGSSEALIGGGFGIGHGTRKAGFRWVFGDLSEEELDRLFDIALDRGTTRPLIVVEDPDATPGLNERLHYSKFDSFEHYERGDPTKHRWGLSVTQWA